MKELEEWEQVSAVLDSTSYSFIQLDFSVEEQVYVGTSFTGDLDMLKDQVALCGIYP